MNRPGARPLAAFVSTGTDMRMAAYGMTSTKEDSGSSCRLEARQACLFQKHLRLEFEAIRTAVGLAGADGSVSTALI